MLSRFDLVTDGRDGPNTWQCAVYAPSVTTALQATRAAGYAGTSMWDLGQFERAEGTTPFVLTPAQAWDVRGERHTTFGRAQFLSPLLRVHLTPGEGGTSSELLARRTFPPDVRALLEADAGSPGEVRWIWMHGELLGRPADQPVRLVARSS
ncbi:hypothetical protein J2Y00_003639 [Deinococcus soli (ex Cha et al. 2016)]|uniref:Uncharacterized protein n=1 Tax=Deinococcus soli (ex Cha et al. 2016) TaxID=1309411 RepID=A0AAE3XFY5_9DEIO|nr:hypothetical protein [Deinococcus soli (ex Cha et al. 2016)]MDR6220028.1 hypothetical protein [Deinococcus soli (ex Cha et al. 2016)]